MVIVSFCISRLHVENGEIDVFNRNVTKECELSAMLGLENYFIKVMLSENSGITGFQL